MAISEPVDNRDDIEPDARVREIIEHYIAEFKDRGCLSVIIRLLREQLPESMFILLQTAVDKEGSIVTLIFNAIRFYLMAFYSPMAMMQAQAPAPQQAAPAPQVDPQAIIVSKVMEKALEKAFSDDEEKSKQGGLLALLAPMLQGMMTNMMQNMMNNMMMGMKPPTPTMPMMPNLGQFMPQAPPQVPQQQPPQQQPKEIKIQDQNKEREDIL